MIFSFFFFFLRKTQAHSQALLLYITVRVDLWICFLPMKDHASSFVSKKSVALGIETIDKNKAILERMVEYKIIVKQVFKFNRVKEAEEERKREIQEVIDVKDERSKMVNTEKEEIRRLVSIFLSVGFVIQWQSSQILIKQARGEEGDEVSCLLILASHV